MRVVHRAAMVVALIALPVAFCVLVASVAPDRPSVAVWLATAGAVLIYYLVRVPVLGVPLTRGCVGDRPGWLIGLPMSLLMTGLVRDPTLTYVLPVLGLLGPLAVFNVSGAVGRR